MKKPAPSGPAFAIVRVTMLIEPQDIIFDEATARLLMTKVPIVVTPPNPSVVLAGEPALVKGIMVNGNLNFTGEMIQAAWEDAIRRKSERYLSLLSKSELEKGKDTDGPTD